jgi:hypothetical protein
LSEYRLVHGNGRDLIRGGGFKSRGTCRL